MSLRFSDIEQVSSYSRRMTPCLGKPGAGKCAQARQAGIARAFGPKNFSKGLKKKRCCPKTVAHRPGRLHIPVIGDSEGGEELCDGLAMILVNGNPKKAFPTSRTLEIGFVVLTAPVLASQFLKPIRF